MTRLVALLLLGLVTLTSCFLDSGDFGSSLSGTVTDSITGLPIESALVYWEDTLHTTPFFTDSAGIYHSLDFGYGPTVVFVCKTAYHTGVRYLPKWRGDKKSVDFRLVPD
jgi:hypothetical protein